MGTDRATNKRSMEQKKKIVKAASGKGKIARKFLCKALFQSCWADLTGRANTGHAGEVGLGSSRWVLRSCRTQNQRV